MDPDEVTNSKKDDIESELLALFETHQRVCQRRSSILKQYDDSDMRGVVLESFDAMSDVMADTAIDRVHNHIDMMNDRQEQFE